MALTEQEWVYEYFHSGKRSPVILGTRGTWVIQDQRVVILIAFSLTDIHVLKDIYNVSKNHPIREVKYKGLHYFAVNIVNKTTVELIIDAWSE